MQTPVIVPAMIIMFYGLSFLYRLYKNRHYPAHSPFTRDILRVGRIRMGFPESAGHSVPVVRMRVGNDGILHKVAICASAAARVIPASACRRRFGTGHFWWSIVLRITVKIASMAGR
ncbi:hypothetical protein KCP75_19995 [Salmonella enterica subsp. enterica]|nr:hypothetical protein KCP75_19995 [Salmonella enterica subsp. enterica]